MGQYNTYGTIEMGLHLSVKPWGFQRDISHILIDYGIYPPGSTKTGLAAKSAMGGCSFSSKPWVNQRGVKPQFFDLVGSGWLLDLDLVVQATSGTKYAHTLW